MTRHEKPLKRISNGSHSRPFTQRRRPQLLLYLIVACHEAHSLSIRSGDSLETCRSTSRNKRQLITVQHRTRTRGGLRSANRGGHQHPRSPPPRVKEAWVWSTHQCGRSKAYPMRAAMQLDTVQPLQLSSSILALCPLSYHVQMARQARPPPYSSLRSTLLAKFHACGGLHQHRFLLVLLPFFLL